mgnify:CR=1 FL=1|jgi:hypothetical protein|tara:strand:+ start:17049 stop:17660 length:612 start_codon:yes stop_codon:yes gene_type:complete
MENEEQIRNKKREIRAEIKSLASAIKADRDEKRATPKGQRQAWAYGYGLSGDPFKVRHLLLALGYLNGRFYHDIERTTSAKPSMWQLLKILEDVEVTKEELNAWLSNRLYIVVAEDLRPGQRAAQAVHAMQEFSHRHPTVVARWYDNSNTVVVLVDPDPERMVIGLWETGDKFAAFNEPDLDGRTTALAILGPTKSLDHLSLA